LARILGRDVLLKLKIKLALLLFATLILSLDADLTFARNAAAQAGSATSANEMAGDHNAEQGSLPEAIAPTEEHGLPQKAVEIARPFGFPITNSMVVSWIVAVGLIIFARLATRDMKECFRGAGISWNGSSGVWLRFSGKHHQPAPESSGRSGFLPQFSFSFFRLIGGPHSGPARSVGDIRPPTVSWSINQSFAGRMPISARRSLWRSFSSPAGLFGRCRKWAR
jgi:hypothetical protein